MKIIVACFLLCAIALTYAKYPLPLNYRELFEEIVDNVKHTSAEVESDDDDISDLLGIFNVLEQIEMEKAKQMGYDDNNANAQFWGALGTTLWNTGKVYLKNKYCSQEAEVRAMIEELVDETESNEAVEEDNNDNFTELKDLVNSLNLMNKIRPLIIDGDVANAEGWFKKLRKSVKKNLKKKAIKKVARKVLC